MWKSEWNEYKIYATLISLVLLMSLWHLSIFYIPALLGVGIAGFIIMRSNKQVISVPIFIIAFILLLVYEILNYYHSSYQPNSIIFLKDFLLILCCTLLLTKLLKMENYRIYFIIFISIMAGLLALFNIPLFFFKYYESTIYGFNDFSQFRFLYRPLGLLSNEWVTIILCLLPFPIIGLSLFWKRSLIRYVFLVIICLLIFNILISFSRAGILAFILFVGLLNIFAYFNHFLPIKKLLLANIALVFLLIFFALSFSKSIQSSIKQTNSHQRSTEGRLKQLAQIKGNIDNISFFGIGSKNYALLGRSFQKMDLESSFTGRVNNSYIQLAVEKGWIGLLLWLCTIGIFVFYSFQRIKNGTNKLDKISDCIILSTILAILFREIFFSSLFYNSGLLLLFFILLIFNIKGTSNSIILRKSVIIGLVVLFVGGAVYFYFRKPDNALYYAEKGLEYERSIGVQISYDSLYKYPDFSTKIKQDTITQAIQYYKKACLLSPSDAMFQHNLGWLYWMNQQSDSASFYLSQAVRLEPNIAIYRISKGLIVESKDPEDAFDTYKQAILLSPDIIDSPFFKELNKRNPIKTEELLKEASNELIQILSVQYSSIIEAKSGKLLLSLGEASRAYEAFSHVTKVHPNLNRPWYYLGFIEQKKGNFDAMQTLYKKSLFLSPSDHLPLYAFAFYYKKTDDKSKSDSYYKAAEKAWKNKRSDHSSHCKRMYYSDTEKDDVIPQGLLNYITPVSQIQVHDEDSKCI